MLRFDDTAKPQIDKMLKEQDSNGTGLRISLTENNEMEISLAELDKLKPGEEPLRDKITHFFIEHEGFMVIVDAEGQRSLGNGVITYEDGGMLSGRWLYQQSEAIPEKVYAGPDLSDPIVKQVADLLANEINPGLAMHGGRAELLNVLDNKVYLKFGGGCQGCSMIDATVKQGIETRIKEVIPQIAGVVDETDHAAGDKPFFQ